MYIDRNKFQEEAIEIYNEAVQEKHEFGFVISERIFDRLVKPLIEKAARQACADTRRKLGGKS